MSNGDGTLSGTEGQCWGISFVEVKCRVKFLGLEVECQFNSIHGVNKFKVTTKWSN